MLRHTLFTHMHSGGRAAGVINGDEAVPKYLYADGAIPEEEAEVKVLRRTLGFRQGVVHQLLKPSPNRVTPFCSHAEICGGCNWQHLSYSAQLYWKREILVHALFKYGIVSPPVPEVVPSPLLQGYRNKSEYAFSSEPELIFGFHPRDNKRTVFACDHCFLQPPHVHQIAKIISQKGTFRSLQIRTTTLGDTFCILGISQPDHTLFDQLKQEIPIVNGWYYSIENDFIHFGGATHLEEKMDDLRFRYSPNSFYQPNPLQAIAIYRKIKEYAQPSGMETVYDLYTGIGTIACCIAPEVKQVIGIEGNRTAILDAQQNAIRNNIHNTHFIAGDILQTFTPDFINRRPKPHLIVLDPPRSGTLTEIKKAIIHAAPQKIIYVSCNPVSLAWDLKQLCAGGYRITAIQPFDMFPHTHHVETVCLLELL